MDRLTSPDVIGKSANQRESIVMNPQASVVLALTGAAIMVLGCTQDPGGTAPGGLEPSASSQQSGEGDDTGSGSGASGSQSGASDDGDSDDGGSGSGDGGAGSTN
jgi:hypothetical protein